MARARLFLFLCVFWIIGHPQAAAESPSPRIILVVFNSLSAVDLADPNLPHLQALVRSGQAALMNTAVAAPRTDAAAVLTMALGTLVSAEPTDASIFQAGERVEGTTAVNVYRRRIGPIADEDLRSNSPTAEPAFHLGWAPLLRRKIATDLIGSILARTGKREFLVIRDPQLPGNEGRMIALFGVNERGVARRSLLAPDSRERAEDVLLRLIATSTQDLALSLGRDSKQIRPTELRRLDSLLGRLQERGTLLTNRLILVSPHPPASGGGAWDRLSVAVLAGPGLSPGLISSPTTRTSGLIANIDIAPTLLSWLGIRSPASMTGHAVRLEPRAAPDIDALLRMDRKVYQNGRGLVPVFAVLAGMGAIILAAGLLAIRSNRSPRLAAAGVLCMMAMPVATLAAGAVDFPSVAALGMGIVLSMLACGVAISLLVGLHSLPSEWGPIFIGVLTIGTSIIDALAGQHLVKFSLFSGYQLQGIRFYGIGNEFMGVLIGFTLLVAFMTRSKPFPTVVWFALVAFLLGWPGIGANAGGLVAATVAFTMGLLALSGKRPGFPAFVLSAGAGLVFALLFAVADRTLSGGAASHLGGALTASNERGLQYLGEIVLRKVTMNLRIVTHPAVLIAIATVISVVSIGSRGKTSNWRKLADAHPGWRDGLSPAAWGALAAFVFNDSGIVAALFLFGTFLATGVYLLFAGTSQDSSDDPALSGTLID